MNERLSILDNLSIFSGKLYPRWFMYQDELQQAMAATLAEIEQINRDIDKATDPKDERALSLRKKELQYLQLRHIEQLENLK